MKKLDKNAYQEKRPDKTNLIIVGVIVMLVALALTIGGVVLFVKGIQISGIFATIWRIVLAIVMVLIGLPLVYIAFMMLVTAHNMINVLNGSVSDVGNSAIGTVNINKCPKCGKKLSDDAEFCNKCGTKVEGVVKCACGFKNSVDAEFCSKCGKKLK